MLPPSLMAGTRPTHRTIAVWAIGQTERGRFVELFHLQAEEGGGITSSAIDIAIKQYHVKQAQLEVIRARAKAKEGKIVEPN
jgi:hypothetical protein